MNAKVYVACALSLLAFAPTSDATPALDFTGLAGNQAWEGRLGNYFDVLSPIDVTSLGAFDDPTAAGFVDSIRVGIFDVGANTLLVSTTIGPGAVGTLVGGVRYLPIPTQTLGVGSYAVVAVGFGHDFNYNTNIGPSPFPGLNTGGGLISIPFLSGLYDFNGSLGTNLTGVISGPWQFGGGSFEFAEAGAAPVPEPGTVVLLGLGLVGLARKRLR
jgi:PEP-CTERM motif